MVKELVVPTVSASRQPASHRALSPTGPRGVLPSPGRIWSRALLVTIIAGALPVLVVWWQNTLPGTVNGPGAYLTAAGRITGLLAAYLLLVLVALMARIPWLDNRVGSDVVARYHRSLGEYTVALACAHAGLIIVGYSLTAGTNPVAETVTVELSYPDVMMATAALALLVWVGVVSARSVRRKLAYESWYFIHLYVYLAMALAFAHEFAVGTEFSGSLRNRVLWSAVHIAVAATLIGFRVLRPLVRSLTHGIRVAEVVPEGPDVVSIYLAGRKLDRLRCEPGQFFRWRFLARGMWWESHPYSLSAAPTTRTLRVTVKTTDENLARLRPGTRVWFEGPYGAFTARRGRRHRTLLIAGGAGITPIRALYETLPGHGADVILLYRASREADLVLWRELETIARTRGFGLYPILGSREWHRGDPLGPDALLRLVPDVARRDVYLCGPPGLVQHTTRQLRRAGVAGGRIHVEAFDL
jgi:predicted ferric reductase